MCGMSGMGGMSMPTGTSVVDATVGMNGTMTFSMSTMSPFFSPWGSYQLQLLFSTWNITEPWQFALSWIAVALTAIIYQCLESVYHALEHGMMELLNEKSQRMQILLENGEFGPSSYVALSNQTNESNSDDLPPFPSSFYVHRPRGWQLVKLTLAFVAALRYTLGLMLMLVVMTFNPTLFLAVVLGYLVGDYVCCDYKLDRKIIPSSSLLNTRQSSVSSSSITGKNRFEVRWVRGLLRWLLLLPSTNTTNTKADNNTNTTYSINATEEEIYALPSSSPLLLTQWTLWLGPRVTSLTFLIVLLAWIVQVEGGIGFANSLTVFGWHALFMAAFVVMFSQESVLTYTAPLFPQLSNDSTYLHYWESFNHILALTSMIIGMVAIVDYKAWTPLTDEGNVAFPFWPTWTAHSWLGMCTLCLWFLHMLYQGWKFVKRILLRRKGGVEEKKGYVEKWHAFLGYGVYATGLASCATGLMDMQGSDLAPVPMTYPPANITTTPTTTNTTNTMTSSLSDDGTNAMYAYTPHSYFSQLACAGVILLFMVGMSTQATVTLMPLIAKMARIKWMRRVKQGLDQEIVAPGQGLGPGSAAGQGQGLASDVEIPAAHASCYPTCQCGPHCTCGPACGTHGRQEEIGNGVEKNVGIEDGKEQGPEQPVVVKASRGVIPGNKEEAVGDELSQTDFLTHPTIRTCLWWTPRLCSILFLLLLLIWLCGTSTTMKMGEGGFGSMTVSKGKMRVFGWHALFMTLFAVVFSNEAVLSFVAPWSVYLPSVDGYTATTRLHVLCHVLAMVCMIVGMVAIVNIKAVNTTLSGAYVYPNWTMWSTHSWTGAMTLACWGLQVLTTILHKYVLPRLPSWMVTRVSLPAPINTALHRGLGHAIYAMALTSCATGLQSRQTSDVGLGIEPPFSPQSRLNAGMSVVLFSLGISTYAALTFLPTKRMG